MELSKSRYCSLRHRWWLRDCAWPESQGFPDLTLPSPLLNGQPHATHTKWTSADQFFLWEPHQSLVQSLLEEVWQTVIPIWVPGHLVWPAPKPFKTGSCKWEDCKWDLIRTSQAWVLARNYLLKCGQQSGILRDRRRNSLSTREPRLWTESLASWQALRWTYLDDKSQRFLGCTYR